MAGESSTKSMAVAETDEEMTLTVKWRGKEYSVGVCGDETVGELKRRICQVTNVLPKRQKLLYPKIVGPKLSDDSTLLSSLPLKSSLKMTMIGTVEDDIIVETVDSPEIVDDFELGQDKYVNQQKLRRRVNQYKEDEDRSSPFLAPKPAGGAASKKMKTETDVKPNIKEESSRSAGTKSTPPSSSKSAPPSSSKSGASSSQGPVREEEIKAVLLQRAPLTTSDLVATFKARLKSPDDKKAFAEILRRIAKIQKSNNVGYVVLRK